VLVISVIWDLLQSQYMVQTKALGSVLLAVSGTMAGAVWIESYCRHSTGTACKRERVWQDSRKLVFLVFNMAAVIEILLDRFGKLSALRVPRLQLQLWLRHNSAQWRCGWRMRPAQ